MAITIGNRKFDREKRKKQEDANDKGFKGFMISLAVIYLLTATIATTVLTPRVMKANRKYENGEIVILNDNDFTIKYNLPGSGAFDDPYRLENITLQTKKLWGIYIDETTKHFIIKNCTIKANQTSILILHVAFGTGIVENNTCIANSPDHYSSIIVNFCSGTKILKNICKNGFSDNNYGISLYGSPNCIISENICNNFREGISCYNSIGNLDIRNNICNYNTVSGINIYNYVYSDYYTIDSIVIYNNTCLMNYVGLDVTLQERFYVFIIENNFSNNTIDGISLEDHDCESIIANNQISNNGLGIRLYSSWNITIEYNHINNNTDFGMILSHVYNCYVYQNNFLYNNLVGQIEGLKQASVEYQRYYYNHFWYNNATKKGNYWSDLVWSETAIYNITNTTDADLYPLQHPVDI